jgi:hypothetical protein
MRVSAVMSAHKRFARVAIVAGMAFAALGPLRTRPSDARVISSFTPPQRALGDFDGDGRADLASIQRHAGRQLISVQLSGSQSLIQLDVAVSALIENDIDHDGDLDLVAAKPDGEVLVWLNDGHGRFTRRAASPTRRLGGEATVLPTNSPTADAIAIRTSLLSPPRRRTANVVVTRIRPPNGDVRFCDRRPDLPALRAPPAARS